MPSRLAVVQYLAANLIPAGLQGVAVVQQQDNVVQHDLTIYQTTDTVPPADRKVGGVVYQPSDTVPANLKRVTWAGGWLQKALALAGPSIIGLWPGNEQSGTVAYDLSGRGHHGAYTGVSFVVPGSELLTNGGFETAGAGEPADAFGTWTENVGDGAVARTTAAGEFYAGSAAAKVTAGAAKNTNLAHYSVAAVPWTQYAATFWSRGDGTNQGRHYPYDTTGAAVIGSIRNTGIAGTTYGLVNDLWQAPGGCVDMRYYLRCTDAAGGIAYFDDASLVAAAPNGPIPGLTAPYYDGVNDYCNIYSAALAAAFNGAEGTLLTWARVSGAGVWTDGATRYIARLRADDSNEITIRKAIGADTFYFSYIAGNTFEELAMTQSATGWLCAALTWSKSQELVQYAVNGVIVGTDVNLGVWSGNLAPTTAVLGAGNTSAGNPWSGLIGPTLLANRAFSPAEIAALSVVN